MVKPYQDMDLVTFQQRFATEEACRVSASSNCAGLKVFGARVVAATAHICLKNACYTNALPVSSKPP